ncbi:hypothetical protein B0H11DRAFT_2240715 [Mycena galericulata]|nr:hypothetical protein B0H11DRAFT_2240715 [Mycena galericulata]
MTLTNCEENSPILDTVNSPSEPDRSTQELNLTDILLGAPTPAHPEPIWLARKLRRDSVPPADTCHIYREVEIPTVPFEYRSYLPPGLLTEDDPFCPFPPTASTFAPLQAASGFDYLPESTCEPSCPARVDEQESYTGDGPFCPFPPTGSTAPFQAAPVFDYLPAKSTCEPGCPACEESCASQFFEVPPQYTPPYYLSDYSPPNMLEDLAAEFISSVRQREFLASFNSLTRDFNPEEDDAVRLLELEELAQWRADEWLMGLGYHKSWGPLANHTAEWYMYNE